MNILKENIRETLQESELDKDLLSTGNWRENEQMGSYQVKMFLHSKENNQSKETTHRTGKIFANYPSNKKL